MKNILLLLILSIIFVSCNTFEESNKKEQEFKQKIYSKFKNGEAETMYLFTSGSLSDTLNLKESMYSRDTSVIFNIEILKTDTNGSLFKWQKVVEGESKDDTINTIINTFYESFYYVVKTNKNGVFSGIQNVDTLLTLSQKTRKIITNYWLKKGRTKSEIEFFLMFFDVYNTSEEIIKSFDKVLIQYFDFNAMKIYKEGDKYYSDYPKDYFAVMNCGADSCINLESETQFTVNDSLEDILKIEYKTVFLNNDSVYDILRYYFNTKTNKVNRYENFQSRITPDHRVLCNKAEFILMNK